jgi:hypothetical protein
MHRQALLEVFKPVEDDVDLGRDGNSSLDLIRVDNADDRYHPRAIVQLEIAVDASLYIGPRSRANP